MKEKTVKTLKLLGGGLAAGTVNALIGAGGGMIAVPTLCASGIKQNRAHSTSVAVIMPLSLLSAVLYLKSGNVSLKAAFPYIIPGIVGAAAGCLILQKIPQKWLRRIFAAFMIWAGVRIVMKWI